MIGVVRVKQRHWGNVELLNSSSSSSGTKLDLIYALEMTVFHFRVVLYSPYSVTKKINLPRNEKVGNELRRLLRRWRKIKDVNVIFFSFNSQIDCRERHVFYFRRNFDLTSSCENVRARLNFWMYNFSKSRPLYNWMFQVSKSIALSGIKGIALLHRQLTCEREQINAMEIL